MLHAAMNIIHNSRVTHLFQSCNRAMIYIFNLQVLLDNKHSLQY